MPDSAHTLALDEPAAPELRTEPTGDGAHRRRAAAAAIIAAVIVGEIFWARNLSDPLAIERNRIAAMNDAERAVLATDWERFRKLAAEEQRRLRQLHVDVEADADPDALRRTLTDYQQWKSKLSPQQSAELVGATADVRLARVRSLTAEQQAGDARRLGPDDARAVITWLESQVQANQQKLLAQLPEQARQRLESLDGRERNWSLMLFLLTTRSPDGPRLDGIAPEALTSLRAALSPQLQAVWDGAKTTEERRGMLADLLRQAISWQFAQRSNTDAAAPRVDVEELRKFFDQELNEAERRQYLGMSREEMTQQLRREYLRRKGIWREPSFGEGPFGRGPFLRPNNGAGGGVNGDRRPQKPGEERRAPIPPGGQKPKPTPPPPTGAKKNPEA